ncbi:hypothetical protein VB715_09090 [Crocosphaera sp. UHCC 0190]|uniref:hypothetical protein n=1 Tax=Crocosphaera sp. UHCC 0190 TaxID=3110246 RepID=UPI002B2185BF|nr:hypothetical protein [Crocosphaera sp. UHCC 0190]MEA5509918.1 hypothetical protein [Crocosphaera sp. UHCC 0190]
MSDEELKQLIASNAKVIEALANTIAEDKAERKKAYQQWEKDRSQLYQYMGRIAAAQSSFYEIQADYYHQLATLSEKQTTIKERQVEIQEKISQQQSQIIEILNRLTSS